jgi:MFS family permease
MTSATQTLRADAQVIGLVGLGHGTSHFFHLLLAPLFPWLKDAFGLSYAELGLLMTVFFIVSGVGQALAGFVVDRIGALPILLGGLALLCISALGLAASNSYAALMLFAAVAGAGNSVFHPADFTVLNRRVSTSSGTGISCRDCDTDKLARRLAGRCRAGVRGAGRSVYLSRPARSGRVVGVRCAIQTRRCW